MANILPGKTVDLEEKFRLMQENAQYDIASSMDVRLGGLSDIKASVRAPEKRPKVPKIFLSNECIFNCAYCGCRSGNDCKRTYQTSPHELADFSVGVAKQYRAGIFISSAIFKSPDYTGELIAETLRLIRQEHGYRGFVHAKVMPGTDPELIRAAGLYADRLSVNIEVAKSEGYERIAKNKNKANILTPMAAISRLIREAGDAAPRGPTGFATSQTTQLMVGSTGEDDRTILTLSGALYRKYRLSRVYYTGFDLRERAAGYEGLDIQSTPSWRVHRLYQADRLMQEYGFDAGEVLTDSEQNLRQDLDPKLAWALRNMHLFPVEVNKADYEMLLRIPGIGVTLAKRILLARRQCAVTHDVLKELGVSLKKARHFVTCNGKFTGCFSGDPSVLYGLLADFPQTEAGGQLYFDMGAVHRLRPWALPKPANLLKKV